VCGKQLGLFDHNPNCPFVGLFEDGDDKCYSFPRKNDHYEVISEDRVDFGEWLSDIGGVLFDTVGAKDTPKIILPSFLPTVPGGGRNLDVGSSEEYIGITLGTIVSLKQLKVKTDIRTTLGLPPETKLILMSYGRDELIENTWPRRWEIYEELLKLGLDMVTCQEKLTDISGNAESRFTCHPQYLLVWSQRSCPVG
jgi:hypothetical protein